MYKILLTIFLVININAEIIDGVSIVVKGEAITLYDIKKEMKLSNIDSVKASNMLIRKALEDAEIMSKGIEVSSSEVYADIKNMAIRNNMSISTFYEAIRNSNGLTSSDLKEKIKQKLLSQKLYSAIAYSAMSKPSDAEIQEYFELHKESFSHPSSFTVSLYQSKNKHRLQSKIDNPMFYAPDIQVQEQVLEYSKISPVIASLLEKTAVNSFTSIIPNAQGAFMSFYLKEVASSTGSDITGFKNEIVNTIMANKREQVLGDYFAKLRHNADIKMIREVQ